METCKSVYVVMESYDGEINVEVCDTFEKAVEIKEEFRETLKQFNYEPTSDEDNYFSAEIHDMLYIIEIREKLILC